MTTSNQLSEAVKKLIGGTLWTLGVCWFLYSLVGNPLDELALIRRAQIAAGSLIETVEAENEDGRGRVYFSDVGVYAYRLPDGREFKATTRVPTGELEERQEVEYLPDDPAVSRIKGDGCQSVVEWLWRKILLGGILLASLSWLGVAIMRDAICDMMRIRTDATALPHWCRGHWLDE